MVKLKLLWDFRGPHAQGIAQHHATHLDEFLRREGLAAVSGSECLEQGHWTAWLIVERHEADRLRQVLRPNRAVEVDPDA